MRKGKVRPDSDELLDENDGDVVGMTRITYYSSASLVSCLAELEKKTGLYC